MLKFLTIQNNVHLKRGVILHLRKLESIHRKMLSAKFGTIGQMVLENKIKMINVYNDAANDNNDNVLIFIRKAYLSLLLI